MRNVSPATAERRSSSVMICLPLSSITFIRLVWAALRARPSLEEYYVPGSRGGHGGPPIHLLPYFKTFFRKRPVCDFAHATIALGGPTATTLPPSSPPSGPRSM